MYPVSQCTEISQKNVRALIKMAEENNDEFEVSVQRKVLMSARLTSIHNQFMHKF